jgi:hypothetical protein
MADTITQDLLLQEITLTYLDLTGTLCRTYFNLPRVYNWSQINPALFREQPELFQRLEEVHGARGISDLDLYLGGMLESHEGPGPLFRYSTPYLQYQGS